MKRLLRLLLALLLLAGCAREVAPAEPTVQEPSAPGFTQIDHETDDGKG